MLRCIPWRNLYCGLVLSLVAANSWNGQDSIDLRKELIPTLWLGCVGGLHDVGI